MNQASCHSWHDLVWYPPTINEGWPVWPIEYGWSANVWLIKLGHKRHWSFYLGVSDCLIWWKPFARVWRHWSSPVVRPTWRRTETCGQHPIPSWQLCNELHWKWISQPHSSLKMIALTGNIWLQLHDRPWTKPLLNS